MSDKTVRYLRLTGESERPTEQLIHDFRKEVENARRYGHDFSLEVVSKSELQELDDDFR